MNRNRYTLKISILLMIILVIVSTTLYLKDSKKNNLNSDVVDFKYEANWVKTFFNNLQMGKAGIQGKTTIAILDTVLSKDNQLKVTEYNDQFEQNNSNQNSAGEKISHGDEILDLLLQYGPKKSNIYYSTVASIDGEVQLESLEDSLEWAISKKVDFINLSLTLNKKSLRLDKLLKRANENGIVIFASAGNEGNSSLSYPASSQFVNAVGGLDKKLNRWYYSNYSTSKQIYFMPSVDVKFSNRESKDGTSYSSILLTSYASKYYSQEVSKHKRKEKKDVLKYLFYSYNSNFYFPYMQNYH